MVLPVLRCYRPTDCAELVYRLRGTKRGYGGTRETAWRALLFSPAENLKEHKVAAAICLCRR